MPTNDQDLNNMAPEGHDETASLDSLLNAPRSRRRFLRTAVIGTAGVAGAAGVAGIVLAERGGALPGLLPIAPIVGVSTSDLNMLFEDTNCGTSGTAADCADYSTTNFTVGSNGTSTNPGSFFVVLAISGLPADTYTITADEKLDSAGSYSAIPAKGSGTGTLPFEYQSPGTPGPNSQIYIYPTGTITGSGPYALTAAPYNAPTTTDSGGSFTTSATQDVLIFLHVNWNGGTIGSAGATETIDFQITLTGSTVGSATETCTTTAVQG